MKNLLAIGIGLALVMAALLVDQTTAHQDLTSQPQAALAIETALHASPTPVPTDTPPPTPSLTPLPTVTPIANWLKFASPGVEIWLPPNYVQLKTSDRVTVKRIFTRGSLEGTVVLYAYDSRIGLSLPLWDVSIIRVQTTLSPSEVPYGIEARDGEFETPVPVYTGRYPAFRSVASGPGFYDIPVHMKDLVYWIRHGEFYWIVLYTAPDYDFANKLPFFEESIRTLTILGDG